jgi:aspartate aminotransferase
MLTRNCIRRFSWKFTNLKTYPPDPILSLNNLCKEDTNPNKVNLTIGAYRDEDGKPWVLPSVNNVIQEIYSNPYDIEYLSLKGDREFVDLATNLIYDYSSTGKQLKESGRIAQLQSLSGTGAIFFLLRFYRECINPNVKVYVQNPSWPIHNTILSNLNMNCEQMPYYNMETRTFNRQQAIESHKNVDPGSLVIVQVCGHNPTGFDLEPEDWKEIIEVYKQKGVDVLVDNPYQGYVSGDVSKDAQSIGLFVDSGLNVMFAQSFAKNFGLYSGRVGCMSMICSNEKEALQVEDNLAYFIRNSTSTHPKFGAEIIKRILRSPEHTEQWHIDLKTMADRINFARSLFVSEMQALGSKDDWSYILEQRGMFALTHLDRDTVIRLRNEKNVYMIESGRISVSGINPNNVKYLSKSIFDIVG